MGSLPFKHVRPVRPLEFPSGATEEDELVPQGRRHHHLCQALYEILRAVVDTSKDSLGADQYVYYRATNPRRKLAPDAFVKQGVPDRDFDSWKTWEHGAPDVAFEVLSPSDAQESWSLRVKLVRYADMGVRELYVFNVDAPAGKRLRAWDRVKGDFVERLVEDDRTFSSVLGVELYLDAVTIADATYPIGLRVRRVREGVADVPLTSQERQRASEADRRASEAGRRAAEERVAALEAELARLRGQGP